MTQPKRRLLFVQENSSYGGGERAFAQLINGLDKGRFDVYVACITGTPGSDVFVREISRSARVIPLDMSWLLNFSIGKRIRAIVKEHAIEVVHSQGPRADFYCRLALQEAEAFHVCTVASPVEEYDVGFLRKAVYIAADRFLAYSVDKYIAVADHIGVKLIERGIPESSVRVIYNGVDIPYYSCDAEQSAKARAALGVPPGSFLVAAFCRFSREKGITVLAEAASMTLGLGISYVVAGAGKMEGEIRERVSNLGLEKDFRLAGFMKDVRQLLWACDAVTLPSLREGFPMSVLEAMAAGKPVIASRIDGVAESVDDGETGLLVPPGDEEALAKAIKSLASDRVRALEMGRRGAESARAKFSLEKMVAEHERTYMELVA